MQSTHCWGDAGNFLQLKLCCFLSWIFCREEGSSLEQCCQFLVVSAFLQQFVSTLYNIRIVLVFCYLECADIVLAHFCGARLRSICRSSGSAARCGDWGGAGLVHMWTPNGPHPPLPTPLNWQTGESSRNRDSWDLSQLEAELWL